MSTDSALDDLRSDIRLTDAPQDRTSYVIPWATTTAPSLSLDATTTKALDTPARLTAPGGEPQWPARLRSGQTTRLP
jgi:hypothetical protein